MTMPIATQVADAITTIKGRLYAKAGELYWRKPSNGTIYQLTPTGGGGGGNNLIPTDIVDPAAAPYVVQPGTLVPLFFSAVDSTVTFANGVTDGDRAGVVGYYGGGSTPGKINIDRGTNISSSMWNPTNKYLQYNDGQFKALTFVWSAINSFWCLESASVFDTGTP